MSPIDVRRLPDQHNKQYCRISVGIKTLERCGHLALQILSLHDGGEVRQPGGLGAGRTRAPRTETPGMLKRPNSRLGQRLQSATLEPPLEALLRRLCFYCLHSNYHDSYFSKAHPSCYGNGGRCPQLAPRIALVDTNHMWRNPPGTSASVLIKTGGPYDLCG